MEKLKVTNAKVWLFSPATDITLFIVSVLLVFASLIFITDMGSNIFSDWLFTLGFMHVFITLLPVIFDNHIREKLDQKHLFSNRL
jgi:hypothetical protein